MSRPEDGGLRVAAAHAVSAAAAGATALTLLYPLDTIRIRQQQEATRRQTSLALLRSIIELEGAAGLYRGLRSSLGALIAANLTYFGAYNALKGPGQPRGLNALLVPALAGVINVVVTCPVWVISTRLRTADSDLTPLEIVRELIRREGVGALWSGLAPSLWLVSNPTIQFLVYERLKAIIGPDAHPLRTFLIAALAKLISTTTTYPLQVAQTRLRCQRQPAITTEEVEPPPTAPTPTRKSPPPRPPSPPAPQGILDCLRELYEERGLEGLYAGLSSKLAFTVAAAAFMFAVYERLATRVVAATRPRLKANR